MSVHCATMIAVLAGHDKVMSAEEVHVAIPPGLRPATVAVTMSALDSLCTMGMATHESLPPLRTGHLPRVAYRIRRPERRGC